MNFISSMWVKSYVLQNAYGFTGSTTAEQVLHHFENDLKLDLQASQTTVLITGTTNGIGKACVKALAKMNHPPVIVMANRNQTTSEALAKELKAMAKNRDGLVIHNVELDLNSLASVRRCVSQFEALDLPLNVLLLNAGILTGAGYEETGDGFEKHFGVNFLANFLLTSLLMRHLVRGAKGQKDGLMSRVVFVSSNSHFMGSVKCGENVPITRAQYGRFPWWASNVAYAQSKLCEVLIANEFNRRCQQQKLPVVAMSLHPATATPSNIAIDSRAIRGVMYLMSFVARTLDQAAATPMYCSFAPELTQDHGGGLFYDKCSAVHPSPQVTSEEGLRQSGLLWDLAMKLCGFSQDPLAAF